MEIRIVLDATDPPAGRMVPEGGPQEPRPTDVQAFAGWLDLMRALYALIPARGEAGDETL